MSVENILYSKSIADFEIEAKLLRTKGLELSLLDKGPKLTLIPNKEKIHKNQKVKFWWVVIG